MTILAAVSRAHTRDRVLEVAIRLGEAFDQDLYVVHLVEGEKGTNDPSQVREEIRQHLLGKNVVSTVAVESVDPALTRTGPQLGEALLELATDADVAHVVVGHRSKGLVEDIAQGNTAFTVADAAPVPVTIVPERAAETDQ